MLSIQNLSKSFGSNHAMQNISLDLKPGLFGLLGPNGAGKSTLMRTLATLQKPDTGSITLDGQNILTDPNAMRSTLGYLPQDFGVYPRMSAKALLDHIAVLKGISPKAERDAQILSLLKNVNLLKHSSANVSTYSGGMRQRFGVAQAMLGNPKVLIVDEPTAGLDPFERQRFLDLLSEAGEDKIIILSTHIVEDVADLCPKMAVIAQGRIELEGAPLDLISRTKGSIWSKTIDRHEFDSYSTKYEVISTRLFAGSTIIHILSDIDPKDGFAAVDGGLEDVYFSTLAATRRNTDKAA